MEQLLLRGTVEHSNFTRTYADWDYSRSRH